MKKNLTKLFALLMAAIMLLQSQNSIRLLSDCCRDETGMGREKGLS